MNSKEINQESIEDSIVKINNIKFLRRAAITKQQESLDLFRQSKNLLRELIDDINSGITTTGDISKDWCLANYHDVETSDIDIFELFKSIEKLKQKFINNTGKLIWIIGIEQTPFNDYIESHVLGRLIDSDFKLSYIGARLDLQYADLSFPIKNFVMISGSKNGPYHANGVSITLTIGETHKQYSFDLTKFGKNCKHLPPLRYLNEGFPIERVWLEVIIGEESIDEWIVFADKTSSDSYYRSIMDKLKSALDNLK